jgi:acyl-[acyl carrier protein]--UDP-N-acetylglucosamine O-acyltransferase
MAAPTSGVSLRALVGGPPEHREYRAGGKTWHQPDIAADALVEAFATVDCGTYRRTLIGPRSWLMKHVHVGHDVIIGADCELSPGAVVCGSAILGDEVRMGVNSCVLPFVRVGSRARIGAGAVVTKDVPSDMVVVGSPAYDIRMRAAATQAAAPGPECESVPRPPACPSGTHALRGDRPLCGCEAE